MPYKRPVHNSKKYTSPFYSPKPSYSMNASGPLPHKDFFGIPLPNEKEIYPGHVAEKKKVQPLAGVLDFVREHIKIEELILIGLIILMLDESIEDDLLLIILIYILLF
jgi:hypothetical protein